MEGYGKIAETLTRQLKKDGFHWDQEAELAFYKLREAMTKIPVLALSGFTRPFVVETDASRVRLGAVLSQQQRPITYCCQALSSRARLK